MFRLESWLAATCASDVRLSSWAFAVSDCSCRTFIMASPYYPIFLLVYQLILATALALPSPTLQIDSEYLLWNASIPPQSSNSSNQNHTGALIANAWHNNVAHGVALVQQQFPSAVLHLASFILQGPSQTIVPPLLIGLRFMVDPRALSYDEVRIEKRDLEEWQPPQQAHADPGSAWDSVGTMLS